MSNELKIKSNGLRNELKEIRKSIDKLTNAILMAQTPNKMKEPTYTWDDPCGDHCTCQQSLSKKYVKTKQDVPLEYECCRATYDEIREQLLDGAITLEQAQKLWLEHKKMSDRKRFKDTKVGSFLLEKIPGIVGDLANDTPVNNVVRAIIGGSDMSEADKEIALKKLDQEIHEFDGITKTMGSRC